MNIWSNTNTLDGYLSHLSFTADKSLADIALIGGKAIDLKEFPRLRGIFKTGVGRDNVPEAEAKARCITCAFPSAETCTIIYEETANFACHLILKCLYAEVGEFATWRKQDRQCLSGKKLLVVGTGNIGGKVAAKMRAFLRVSTFDILTNRSEDLEALVRESDCISLHIPLTPQTRDYFNAHKLAWMNDGAALVNTARGAIVDEGALLDELSKGRLRAAFDVFWVEPYKGRLMEVPQDRFIVSPHVASTCREFLAATAKDFEVFVKRFEIA